MDLGFWHMDASLNQTLTKIRAFIVFWECSKNQFLRQKNKRDENFEFFFELPHPRENSRFAPASDKNPIGFRRFLTQNKI